MDYATQGSDSGAMGDTAEPGDVERLRLEQS